MEIMTARHRFDIVVFNYKKLELFLNNFNRISNFDPQKDIITVITTSPSTEEHELLKKFGNNHNFQIRYLSRKNKGIDQLGRIEYFIGDVGNTAENRNSEYIFQMQEHYLDTTSPHSRWGEQLDYRVKGDVVPDDVIFDLNVIEELFINNSLCTLFCDRNKPCFFSVSGKNFIAPNGGNFFLRTRLLNNATIISKIKYLRRTFIDDYSWAVFAEHFWGEIFFSEGMPTYDYERKKYYDSYLKEDFYIAPDNYIALRERYTNPYSKFKHTVLKGLRSLKIKGT